MKSLSLQSLDSKSIQLKGFGLNQKLEAISVDKLPGSILVKSNKTSSSVRIYCIYDDFENTWVFALASTKPSYNQNPLDFTINQDWGKYNRSKIEISFPDDASLELEGEFRDDNI